MINLFLEYVLITVTSSVSDVWLQQVIGFVIMSITTINLIARIYGLVNILMAMLISIDGYCFLVEWK